MSKLSIQTRPAMARDAKNAAGGGSAGSRATRQTMSGLPIVSSLSIPKPACLAGVAGALLRNHLARSTWS